MKKRALAILCATIMLMTTLGTVGACAQTADLSGTVSMWAFPLSGDDAAMYEPIIKSFNELYPNVTIDVQVLPWNGRYEKMLTAIAGGNPPNVVYLNDFQIPLFASTGNLLDVSEIYTQDELATVYKPGAIKAVSYEGKTYGVPILQNSLGYLYNVDLFVEAGLDPENPPQTWEELESAIQKLTRLDAGGNIIQAGARFDLNRPSPVASILPLVWQAGGQILDENNNVTINSPETASALNFIKKLFDDNYIQKANITGGGFPFSSGQIGIDLQREPNDVGKVAKENPDLNFKVGPILTGKQKIGYVTVGTFSVFSKSDNRDATIAWVRHLTNKENTQNILAASGFMSPRLDVNAADYMKDERLIFMASQSEWATGTGPMNPHYSEILSVLGSEFNSIILGIKTADAGLVEAENQIKTILAE